MGPILFLLFYKIRWILWHFPESIPFHNYQNAQETAQHYDSRRSSRQKHQEWKEGQRSVWWWRVTPHVHTCSGRNRIIPLMWRPNTDSTPNKPVTLPCNHLFDTLRGHESHPHCHDKVLRYAVTLQVCTHLKSVVEVNRRFRREFGLRRHWRILSRNPILTRVHKFQERWQCLLSLCRRDTISPHSRDC